MAKKYIDTDTAYEVLTEYYHHKTEVQHEALKEALSRVPAADVVEVVRCRECVMWDGSFTLNGQKKCLNMTFCTDGDFYCGWGCKD